MDAVEKRAAGETLSVRDEQRLRNHQLRMMRRQWLNDLVRIYENKQYFMNILDCITTWASLSKQ